ncbi:small ribosomal subunit Rsm22 family protein [Streptomyces sp. NPDC059398]|uniref:small ribosomal subunit Rsm22 family protein n=1 Tax=Streptomyces sp. NPDC059398 TaxID=3346820 RepID=UPI0036BDC02B
MNASLPTAEALRTALAGLLDGLPPKQAAQAVERLIANYRGTTPTGTPLLRDRSDVAAYAAYRMPATFEAVRAALAAFRAAVPGWVPARHTDIGGGTGAASWAVAGAWDDPDEQAEADGTGGADGTDGAGGAGGTKGPRRTTVLDWADPALVLGRELAAHSGSSALRTADWQRTRIGPGLTLESTDLVTVSYVLGELTEAGRTAVVDAAAQAAQAVVVVEPGTPDGYLRIMAARDRLAAAGLRTAAPCPHSDACPIVRGTDWCHFSARVSRSSLHRQVKGGSLAYEDEKFSYVAAFRGEVATVPSRVVRRPQIRKGLVQLELCTAADELTRETVSKRHGDLYRAARDTAWGDPWPPPGTEPMPVPGR